MRGGEGQHSSDRRGTDETSTISEEIITTKYISTPQIIYILKVSFYTSQKKSSHTQKSLFHFGGAYFEFETG